MNWDRHEWSGSLPRTNKPGIETSNLRHTFHENPVTAPYGSKSFILIQYHVGI
jgi:hypothetical protein